MIAHWFTSQTEKRWSGSVLGGGNSKRSASSWSWIVHCQKLKSLGYISIADSTGLASVSLMAPKSTNLDEMMQNNGHYVDQDRSK